VMDVNGFKFLYEYAGLSATGQLNGERNSLEFPGPDQPEIRSWIPPGGPPPSSGISAISDPAHPVVGGPFRAVAIKLCLGGRPGVVFNF